MFTWGSRLNRSLVVRTYKAHFWPHRISVVSKKFEGKTELTEPWYGAGYNYRKIDPRLIEQWRTVATIEEMYLPAANEFIPTNFEIVPLGDNPPKVPTLIQVCFKLRPTTVLGSSSLTGYWNVWQISKVSHLSNLVTSLYVLAWEETPQHSQGCPHSSKTYKDVWQLLLTCSQRYNNM